MSELRAEITLEASARHRRAADAVLHHVRWFEPEIALELTKALHEVAARHGYATVELARGAQELVRELEARTRE